MPLSGSYMRAAVLSMSIGPIDARPPRAFGVCWPLPTTSIQELKYRNLHEDSKIQESEINVHIPEQIPGASANPGEVQLQVTEKLDDHHEDVITIDSDDDFEGTRIGSYSKQGTFAVQGDVTMKSKFGHGDRRCSAESEIEVVSENSQRETGQMGSASRCDAIGHDDSVLSEMATTSARGKLSRSRLGGVGTKPLLKESSPADAAQRRGSVLANMFCAQPSTSSTSGLGTLDDCGQMEAIGNPGSSLLHALERPIDRKEEKSDSNTSQSWNQFLCMKNNIDQRPLASRPTSVQKLHAKLEARQRAVESSKVMNSSNPLMSGLPARVGDYQAQTSMASDTPDLYTGQTANDIISVDVEDVKESKKSSWTGGGRGSNFYRGKGGKWKRKGAPARASGVSNKKKTKGGEKGGKATRNHMLENVRRREEFEAQGGFFQEAQMEGMPIWESNMGQFHIGRID